MFGGELPEIPIYLSDAKTFLGKFCFKKRKLPNGKTAYYDFSLRMNTRLDLPEQEVEDTIIHEMIHYFIAYKNLEDASAHGPIFQHIMKSINERFGRHLTISYKTTAAEREALQDKRPRYHVVAVLQLCDGRFAVKVLPRIMQLHEQRHLLQPVPQLVGAERPYRGRRGGDGPSGRRRGAAMRREHHYQGQKNVMDPESYRHTLNQESHRHTLKR